VIRYAALAWALAIGCGAGVSERDAGDASDASPGAMEDTGAARDARSDARLDGAVPDGSVLDGSVLDGSALRVPTEHAAWPMPSLPVESLPRPQRYEIEAEVVRDAITGLVWERGDRGTLLRTHADAIADCASLVLAGRDDYRLPSRIEWASVVDPTRSPTLDPEAFPDAIAEYHWSASRTALGADAAYSVYLGGGETTIGIASRASGRARCVAGPPPLPAAPYEIDATTVLDRATMLTWSRSSLAATSWDGARSACEDASMRLPTLRELQTIVDEARGDPSVDLAAFPGARAERHWTATVRDAGEVLPWTVDLRDGQTYAEDLPSTPHPAYCVR
jgi:hypothetical protein